MLYPYKLTSVHEPVTQSGTQIKSAQIGYREFNLVKILEFGLKNYLYFGSKDAFGYSYLIVVPLEYLKRLH